MNKIYFFLFSFIVSCTSFASNFHLAVNSTTKMTVVINSQTQTSQSNNFTFSNLAGGFTLIKVYDTWTGNTIFNNNVNIAMNSDVYATLDYNGNMNIYMVTPMNNGSSGTIIGTVTYNSNGTTNPGNTWGMQNGTSNDSFSDFMVMLKDESMDSGKLKLAQNYVQKSYLTVTQIKQICKEFSFDSYRLDFAKSAYANCQDKGNYILMKDVFSFTSNYNSLMEYVKTH